MFPTRSRNWVERPIFPGSIKGYLPIGAPEKQRLENTKLGCGITFSKTRVAKHFLPRRCLRIWALAAEIKGVLEQSCLTRSFFPAPLSLFPLTVRNVLSAEVLATTTYLPGISLSLMILAVHDVLLLQTHAQEITSCATEGTHEELAHRGRNC